MATSGTEVNDLLVRLSAAAHNVHGSEGAELMYLISRLSNAVTRERAAGMTEMQMLRRKVLQQPSLNNSKKPNVMSRNRAGSSATKQTAVVPTFGNFSQDRLNAVLSGPPLSPIYQPNFDPEFGPLSSSANSLPLGQRVETRHTNPMFGNSENYDANLRQSITSTTNQQLRRKRAASPVNDQPAKKTKAQPQAPAQKTQAKTKAPIALYGLACHICIVSGANCKAGNGRKCTRCQPAQAGHGQCILLPCKSIACNLPNCPYLHQGQCLLQAGKPNALILGVNVHESNLSTKECESIKKAISKVQSARASHRSVPPQQKQQMCPAMSLLPAQATTSAPTTTSTPGEALQPSISQKSSNAPSDKLPLWALTPVPEIRDPRLIARARARPSERRSDSVLATGHSQDSVEQPARVAELTHARVAGAPLGRASTSAISLKTASTPGTRIAGFERSLQTALKSLRPSVAEQQRSIEELLQSLAPFCAKTMSASKTKSGSNASQHGLAAPSLAAETQPAMTAVTSGGAAVATKAPVAASRLEAMQALSRAHSSSAAPSEVGVNGLIAPPHVGGNRNSLNDDQFLEEGEVEEVKTAEQIKAEPMVKMEVDD